MRLFGFLLSLFILITKPVCADSAHTYLQRFKTYSAWNQQLPTPVTDEFLEFIQQDKPLSKKLREKWLYELAKNKDWKAFSDHYQVTEDLNLVCYAQIAHYKQDQHEEAIKTGKKLWINGKWLPKSCDQLFDLLLKEKVLNEADLKQRIHLALEKGNVSLATYLLKQFSPPRLNEIQLLNNINQSPKRITKLQPGEWFSEFYLYGLKRMVSLNQKEAIPLWESANQKHLLNHADNQSFIAQVALYQSMRNDPDAPAWFNKVEAPFYTDLLLDWEIRYALKYEQWKQVERLINDSHDKDSPSWQYWLGRALEAQGQTDKARQTYENIAKIRNYYGFLASLRLNKDFSFEDEQGQTNKAILLSYKPFTDQIKQLYTHQQSLEASRLLNDFISELPKDQKISLIQWLDLNLHWYGKSVYLSNTPELNNQLNLRFPLAFNDAVKRYAQQFQVTEALIYAIIRQESGFREDVSSSAGAEGLMQIMPATALTISKAERIPYVNKQQLFIPQTNINIGAAYLKNLAKRFDHHPILMVAAYNAGPKQVAHWLKTHPPKDIDIWIETLPWHETRNYIKNIIAFNAVYQYRLHQPANLSDFLKPF